MSRRRTWPATLAFTAGLISITSLGACTDAGENTEGSGQIDTRLEHHSVKVGEASSEGLAYVQAVADAHRQADRLSNTDEALSVLLGAASLTPPAGDGTAEILHYEVLARTSELMLNSQDSEGALELLEPRLESSVSLPVDRASARCLVALGDAASHTGDLALAMGSYSRALDMLTLLIEEVEP